MENSRRSAGNKITRFSPSKNLSKEDQKLIETICISLDCFVSYDSFSSFGESAYNLETVLTGWLAPSNKKFMQLSDSDSRDCIPSSDFTLSWLFWCLSTKHVECCIFAWNLSTKFVGQTLWKTANGFAGRFFVEACTSISPLHSFHF